MFARLPGRRLEDRPAVVGRELGRRHDELLAPASAAASPARPRRTAGRRRVIGSRRPREAHGRTAPRRSAAAAGVPPHRRQVAGGDHRVRRQAVDLGLVEQQEERAVAADAVVGVVAVQPGARLARARAAPRPGPRRAPAARRGRRTGSTRSGRPWRRPAPGRRRAGRSTWCTSRPGRRPRAGRSRRTGRPKRSSRSRCRRPPAPRRCRTRCGSARRWGRRRGRRRGCSACTRRTPSASAVRRLAALAGSVALPRCSMNATCRQVSAPSASVLS